MSVVEPLAAGPLWRKVIAAGNGECRCTGECGRAHAATYRRCPVGIEDLVPVRLYVAPVDPVVPVERAWRLPVQELGVWCGPCLDGLRRHQRPRPAPEATGDLLALLDDTSTTPTPTVASAPAPSRRRSGARRGPPG